MNRLRRRLAIFLTATLTAVVQQLIQPGTVTTLLEPVYISVWVQSGVAWLVIFEYLRWRRPTMSGWRWPVAIVLAGGAQALISVGLTAATIFVWPEAIDALQQIPAASPVPSSLAAEDLLRIALGVMSVSLLFVMSYRFAAADDGALAFGRVAARHVAAYGGVQMSPSKTDTTRLLGGAAVLNGSAFRARVLDRLRDRQRALVPELGLDMGLLARVCASAERRELTYEWMFLAVALLTMALVLPSPVLAAVVGVLGTGLLYFVREYRRRYSLASHFTKARYDPEQVRAKFSTTLAPELEAAIPQDEQELVVYSGFTPFACAGISLGGWSFVVNLDKPKEGAVPMTPEAFQLEQLYDEVDDSLIGLGLGGFVSRDVYFASGTDVRSDRDILPDEFGRPSTQLPREAARHYMNSSDSRVRHYRWYRVHDWSNELIVSQFFRCARRGSSMSVEINRYLMTPVADQYRSVDTIPSMRLQHVAALALLSAFAGPFAAVAALFRLSGRINSSVETLLHTRERHRRREIADNLLFDYGTVTPMRHELSSDRFIHYFQKVDGDLYNKLFDREILDAVCRFLDDHNIDTSDIRERQNVIMNSGIIVQGGDVRAESLAVGAGAAASKTTTRQARPDRREKAA